MSSRADGSYASGRDAGSQSQTGYTALANAFLRDPGIRLDLKGGAAYFASFAWNGAWPRHAQIANHLGLSTDSVARLIKKLTAAGLLTQISLGPGLGWMYEIAPRVFDGPPENADSPSAEMGGLGPSEIADPLSAKMGGRRSARGFTRVPNAFLCSDVVPLEAKGLAAFLFSYSWNESWPYQSQIVKLIRVPLTTQRRWIIALEEANLLILSRDTRGQRYDFRFGEAEVLELSARRAPSVSVDSPSAEMGGLGPSEIADPLSAKTALTPPQIRHEGVRRNEGSPSAKTAPLINTEPHEPKKTATNSGAAAAFEINDDGALDLNGAIQAFAKKGIYLKQAQVNPALDANALMEWINHVEYLGTKRNPPGFIVSCIRSGQRVPEDAKKARTAALRVLAEAERAEIARGPNKDELYAREAQRAKRAAEILASLPPEQRAYIMQKAAQGPVGGIVLKPDGPTYRENVLRIFEEMQARSSWSVAN